MYREAMSDGRQHARATAANVPLVWNRGRQCLVLRDDGMGLPPEVLAQDERPRHDGLRRMREPAEPIGGRLVVNSPLGDGTELTLVLPGRAADRDDPARRFGVDGLICRIARRVRP